MRPPSSKTELAEAAADREAGVIAVLPGRNHADRRKRELRRVGETANAPQLLHDHVSLEFELGRVIGVLQAASAALTEVHAGRSHPLRRGLQDLDNLPPCKISTVFSQFDRDPLTRQAVGDKDNAPLQTANCFAAEGHLGQGQRHQCHGGCFIQAAGSVCGSFVGVTSCARRCISVETLRSPGGP